MGGRVIQGQDPLSQLTPRKKSFQALPEGSKVWVWMSADLNVFLVNVVKWGYYLGGKNRTIILRPLSELNEETAGSWCLDKPGVVEVNTPENYVDVWLAHLSKENNTPSLALKTVQRSLKAMGLSEKGPLTPAQKQLVDRMYRTMVLGETGAAPHQ